MLATVLFTDIVDSTGRAAELGDGPWKALLERHDAIVREEVERHRGRFVKSLGDGSAGGLRRSEPRDRFGDGDPRPPREIGLEIRAGLHTGECELLPDDDVGGLAVHIGSRVSSLASARRGPGQRHGRDLVVGSGHVLTDRGEHELKGVPGPWRVYAVAT